MSFNPWKTVLSLTQKLPKFYSFTHLLFPCSMHSNNTDSKICTSVLPQASLCLLKPAGHQQPSRWSLLQIPHPPSSLIQEQTHFNELAPIHKELIVLTKLIALHLALPDVLQRHSNIYIIMRCLKSTSMSFLINIAVQGKHTTMNLFPK